MRLAIHFKRIYVAVVLWFIGRAMAAMSTTDPVLRVELAGLPDEFGFLLSAPGCYALSLCYRREQDAQGRISATACPVVTERLQIRFKHPAHAFRMLAFQESIAASFARERMTVDGDIARAMVMVRCLNRVACMTLPAPIAKRLVKQYRGPAPLPKLGQNLSLYLRIVLQLIRGR